MFPSGLPAYLKMSKKFEGLLPWPYVDNHKDENGNPDGLVTTGMGNLIDPVGRMLSLPWRHGIGGPLASQQEVIAAFNAVKHSGMNEAGGGNQGHLTDLRLNDEDIQNLIQSKIQENEKTLRQRVPRYDSLPVEVQIVLNSMAWAMGANFKYPKFLGYINQPVPNFKAAADECYMPDNKEKNLKFPPKLNPGLRPRNIANQILLIIADKKVKAGAAMDNLLEPIEQTIAEAYEGLPAIEKELIQAAVKNPFVTAAGVTGFSLMLAAGTYYLATRK
jgi:hypothetical protein